MSARTVRSRAELDAALADPTVTGILIDAPPTEVIDIRETGAKTVDIVGHTQVRSVYGSAQVGSVSGSAQVRYVSGSAQVRYVYGPAQVGSVSGSAQVGYVSGSAQVGYVSGSAQVRSVYDSAQVGSVSGSAQVRYVYDSAQVRYVSGSAQVRYAGPRTLIGRYSKQATINSRGRVVDFTDDVIPDYRDTAAWLDENCLTPDEDGTVALYKAVDADLRSHNGNRPSYTPGTTVTAPDWRDDHECGGGLHVSPNVFLAESCATGDVDRYVRVRVKVAELRGIGFEKCKVPSLVVEAEVDSFGDDLAVTA